MKITKDTLILDIVRKKPEAKKILEEYNMSCLSCLGIKGETVGRGSIMHGVDVDELIQKLSKLP